jgi:ketosteroid isomerase-like protein
VGGVGRFPAGWARGPTDRAVDLGAGPAGPGVRDDGGAYRTEPWTGSDPEDTLSHVATDDQQETVMTRTPQQIFEHHAGALIAGDIDEIVADYTEDAVFITPGGVRHGRDGVRAGFTELLAGLPDAKWDVPTQIFEGDILFIEWSAVSASARAMDGIDTFVFDGDGIRAQTVRYTLETTA